jgi:hypothetical protein
VSREIRLNASEIYFITAPTTGRHDPPPLGRILTEPEN